MTMSSSDGMTPIRGSALDILLEENPNWPFGPAMARLRERYMGVGNQRHHASYSQPDSAAGSPALETPDHDPRCLAAIVNPPDQRPYSQPNNATGPPALVNRHGRESSPGIDHPQDKDTDKQRRLDSPGLLDAASKEVRRKSSTNDYQRPPKTIPRKSIAHEKDPSMTHPPTDSAPPFTVKNDTLQKSGCPAERKGVRFELSSSPVKRGSEQPAYPSKRPRMSSPAELLPGSQDASPSNREGGSPSQRRELSSNHASTSAIVSGFTAHVHLPAQTSAAGASAPPKSQYGSLPVLDTRLRLAARIFSYPRNVQEMVLIFCQIGLAHQRLKEWQPNNWPAIGVEEMSRWKHSLERTKQLSDMGFLKDYFQAVKDLGSSRAFQYIPETSGGPGAILLKDCTPLGLMYRPLIKTLRMLGKKRQLSTTMADLSEDIKANLTNTTPARLVAGVTSLQTYIEAAERDGVVFVARLSKHNSTELTVRVELTRPWKASQRSSKSFPIEDAEVDLMKFPGPHRTAIEAYQRGVSATRCALCGDMGHYSIECPEPIKSMSDALKAIELPDSG